MMQKATLNLELSLSKLGHCEIQIRTEGSTRDTHKGLSGPLLLVGPLSRNRSHIAEGQRLAFVISIIRPSISVSNKHSVRDGPPTCAAEHSVWASSPTWISDCTLRPGP
jgi:hypothetical protein